ncbi:alpha/beta fold hydrolase [Bailinhaonella thermotolerans]|uniref:Alpha/beta fold hydrolase n=1 Tax=Bailinhaonella thermotolerans TaxID=1070861 RepID=A0A3A4AGN2_9ACTN|nr:alpha/beta hydrolase [Bailinhaonella thermotolerans]RJL24843.1 alpha/beta fold hydrolase [Bailinhaonella thermotolerans]
MTAYARTVRGSGPGLLLAHGAGGGVEANFGPILDGLAQDHTVVAIDYPGTGATPRSDRPLELDDLSDQLVAAADAEGLDTFAIAGYSLGGLVAMRTAARHPERVTRLVLTAAYLRPDHRFRLAAEVWRDLYRSGDHATLARTLVPINFSAPALDALSAEELESVIDGAAATLPPGSAEHADLASRADVSADAPGITAPTLVISTAYDRLVEPHHHRAVAAALPNAELTEIATGHLPFIERPDEWRKLISDFLSIG